jgi:molecular chaperone DnaK (HSP70)
MGTYIFKLAKKGFELLGKSDKSTDTITVKPSGKKTETKAYLKNRKEPTTYKGTKFENEMRDKFNEARSKNQGILTTPEVEQYQKGKKYLKKKEDQKIMNGWHS